MITIADAEIEALADSEALARRAAEWLTAAMAASTGRFALALAGGGTPRQLYRLLTEPPWRDRVPWPRVHWFWGDERFVPQDHPDSNFAMVRDALLRVAPIPAENIHPMPTGTASPDEAAAAYERVLQSWYGGAALRPERPLFGATLLGLGPDGHIASLFPGSPVLDERARWVSGVVTSPDPPHVPRITLTYPALESSREIAFLVSGAGKRAILSRLLGGGDMPAARLRPVGRLRLFVDRDAAPEKSR
jgi:6-phosphogluconolactonase